MRAIFTHLDHTLLARVKGQWVACGGEGLHNNSLWSSKTTPTQSSLQGPVHSTGIHLRRQEVIGHAEECHLVKEQMKKHSSNSKYSFVLRPSYLPTVQFSIAL